MHDVPLGSTSQAFTQRGPKAVRTEFTGETGYQNFPSIFFILCGYIKYVYIYLYIYTKKLSPIFLWVSKFDVDLGIGEHIFQITLPYSHEFSNIWLQTCLFFWIHQFFWKSLIYLSFKIGKNQNYHSEAAFLFGV